MSSTRMKMLYRGLCPNCGGDASDEELLTNGVCSSCVPFGATSREEVYRYLSKVRKLKRFREPLELSMRVEEFKELFRRLVGSNPWSLQETWARRVLLGRSFSIVAPTGLGKTTFGLLMALYLSVVSGAKSYVLVPSSLLVQHVVEKASRYVEKLGRGVRVVGYASGMTPSVMERNILSISSGDFDVLITTDRFLYNRYELLKGKEFDFVFVDDVDAFLRSPRNIDKVIELMGYDPAAVETVLRMVRISRKRRATDAELEEYEALDRELMKFKRTDRNKVLVVSGATLRARRTLRVRAFRHLFGFEPGHTLELVRNIGNYYVEVRGDVKATVLEILKRHGGGVLVFVPQTAGLEGAEGLARLLNESGISAYAYRRASSRLLNKFVDGTYGALVGVASSRSPLARGLDLPETIRYVVFAGVPRREIKVEDNEYRPQMLLAVLKHVAPLLEGSEAAEALRITSSLARVVPTTAEVVEKVRSALEGGLKLEGFEGHVQELVVQARSLLRRIMTPEWVARLAERADIQMKAVDGGLSLIVPDADGFVQASGRCSRLYVAGITRGVTITVVDDPKAFHGLRRMLETLYEETLEPYEEDKVRWDFVRVDEDRRKVVMAGRGELPPERFDVIKSALVVVESPTKARTIASFFGRPARREIGDLTVYESIGGEYVLTVAASGGHVLDLTTEGGYHGVLQHDSKFVPIYTAILRCEECRAQFVDQKTCPNCGSSNFSSKADVIESLRKLALEANRVYVATDPDSEGEKIGYDLYCNLKPFNDHIGRLEFHEVTRRALSAALSSPRGIRDGLVEAQLLRRIEDRWVGFELSRRLWERFGRKTLSAGRVQTPVLGWVVNRTAEARKKVPLMVVVFDDGTRFEFVKPVGYEELRSVFEEGNLFGEVVEVSSEVRDVLPPPPYTTDSMLKDAWFYLRMGSVEAMQSAQSLFESGLITYHRTDSTAVSTVGLNVARSYLEERHPGLFRPRTYQREGAHECIRPTKPMDERELGYYVQSGALRTAARLTRREIQLYGLIFRRFIASQMVAAKVRYQTVAVKVGENELRMERPVELVEEGFLKVNPVVRVQPSITSGVRLVKGLELRRIPAARLLTEGDLISTMKSKGIGRPSTYAKIVQTLYNRRYVFQNAGRVIATKLGREVYQYLESNYGDLVSEELTRELEAKMDAIEEGKLNYLELLGELHRGIITISKRAV
ncbi:MAG: reverse gyrase [Thaumarchaeota archaeon]|nr:reverse gyrase [Candidatus Calditenuaceae archaeon]MDW8042363.1 reverse gyrase [Nitrososphaerota archaeon]